jgi:flagellar protein FlaG
MSTISPLSGQNNSTNSSTGAVQREQSVTQANTVKASSENTNTTEVANENAQLTVQEVEQTVESLNNAMTLLERGINFEIDRDHERTIIKVVDRENDTVIKQIPSEDLLKLIDHMQEMQALLFEERA